MSANRDHNTLVRVLKRIVLDAGERDQWREELDGFYDAAIEFLLDQGALDPNDYPEAAEKVSISVPLAVAEAFWAMTGAYDPRDSRHPDNQEKITITVPKNVGDVFQQVGV